MEAAHYYLLYAKCIVQALSQRDKRHHKTRIQHCRHTHIALQPIVSLSLISFLVWIFGKKIKEQIHSGVKFQHQPHNYIYMKIQLTESASKPSLPN